MAAAEESGATLLQKRGDALCGLLSAALAISKRGLAHRVHIPELPVVSAEEGVQEIAHFIKVAKVVKGTRNATVGLFGPRPRDFETCNYNLASVNSIGIEVEELGLFDLQNEVRRIKDKKERYRRNQRRYEAGNAEHSGRGIRLPTLGLRKSDQEFSR